MNPLCDHGSLPKGKRATVTLSTFPFNRANGTDQSMPCTHELEQEEGQNGHRFTNPWNEPLVKAEASDRTPPKPSLNHSGPPIRKLL